MSKAIFLFIGGMVLGGIAIYFDGTSMNNWQLFGYSIISIAIRDIFYTIGKKPDDE
jgi:hypothetical protein